MWARGMLGDGRMVLSIGALGEDRVENVLDVGKGELDGC
jgi:hypothetical protein